MEVLHLSTGQRITTVLVRKILSGDTRTKEEKILLNIMLMNQTVNRTWFTKYQTTVFVLNRLRNHIRVQRDNQFETRSNSF